MELKLKGWEKRVNQNLVLLSFLHKKAHPKARFGLKHNNDIKLRIPPLSCHQSRHQWHHLLL